MGNPDRSLGGNGWLHHYMIYTQGQESPSLFHIWTAIWAISTALGRKVWMNKGYYRLIPNFYIILVAGSSVCRKSTAVNLGADMLQKLTKPPLILPQTITPERLVQKMSQEMRPGVKSLTRIEGCTDASACIVAPELSVFLGEKFNNHKMVSLLSELFECKDRWSNDTISRGEDKLVNVYLSLLGASTITWLKKSLGPKEMEGGFANRVIWVCQDTTTRIEAFPYLSSHEILCRDKLQSDLEQIRAISGEYKLTDKARQ